MRNGFTRAAFWFSVMVVATVCLGVMAFAGELERRAPVKSAEFGKLADGTPIDIYTLTNSSGAYAKIMTYGATLTELAVPDKNGNLGDVVLGFNSLDPYIKGHPFFGSTVGRVGNRIAKGSFTLDGKTYHTPINNGPNTLHGGDKGFDKAVWKARVSKSTEGPSVAFGHTSRDGDQGFPGTLNVTVVYTLTNDNSLKIEYTASTDKATPINLTNHTYFNLAGSGDILAHEATFYADKYTPVDANLIPTGQIKSVTGTPFDFTKATAIGSRIAQTPGNPNGYDHNYVINGGGQSLTKFARVTDAKSGRILEGFTTEPGFQFYTGNFLDGTITGKRGVVYNKHAAFCLETQHFPDSVHRDNFPSTILRPGNTYHSTTVYRLSAT